MFNKQLILPNISRSKDNQTMKCGQLIEYNKGNIFPSEIALYELKASAL